MEKRPPHFKGGKKKKSSQKAEGAQDLPALQAVVTHSPPQGQDLSLVTAKPPVPPWLCRTRQKGKRGDGQHQCPSRLVLQEFGWVFFQVRTTTGCPLGHSWMPPHLQPKSTMTETQEGFWRGKNLTNSSSPGARDERWAEAASKLFEKERNSSASSGGQ